MRARASFSRQTQSLSRPDGLTSYIWERPSAWGAFRRAGEPKGGALWSAASAAALALNPARVAEWWLVGYESRQLDRTEFDNDNVDAGDVGAGQSVTVLYEFVLAGTNITVAEGSFPEKAGRMSLVCHPFDPRSGYRPRNSAAAKFANLSVHPVRNCIACISPALWER